MGLQPQTLVPGIEMMPLMPVAGDEPSGPAPQRPEPSRADSVQSENHAKEIAAQTARRPD
jgi:hypothetical protein